MIQLSCGDILDVLRTCPDSFFDAVFCDPPYGLSASGKAQTRDQVVSGKGFMGAAWDCALPSPEDWREMYRVLKPGAPLLAFGGTRTWHRLAVTIEDAGFEIRDTLVYLYGSGMPKSQSADKALDKAAGATREVVGTRTLSGSAALSTKEKGGTYAANTTAVGRSVEVPITVPATDLAKQWKGYGTALKPAWEPCILARKPLDGTMVHNINEHGVGPINIDGCRVGDKGGTAKGTFPKGATKNTYGNGINGACEIVQLDAGRWPANVILDEEAAQALDEAVGDRPSTLTGKADPSKRHDNPGDNGGASSFGGGNSAVYADGGGPSRFFYTAKANKRERGEGNDHPTLKPLALCEYFAKLILPPNPEARLLVPFSGSGSEMIGALLAGWQHVCGIEGEAKYVEIAKKRLAERGFL